MTNNFSITTQLTAKEYAKIMFVGLYKKPGFIFATLLGLYLGITIILDYLNIIDWYQDTPIFEILGSIFLLVAPALIVLITVRQFTSNPVFQNDITYTFNDDGVICQGPSHKTEFLWSHIIKQKDIGKFLILYQDKRLGYFIDKSKLTSGQVDFIKSKIKQEPKRRQ